MLTEIGRQPYVIRGVMLTQDAFTASHAVIAYAVVFPVAYVVLAALTAWILVRHYHDRAHPVIQYLAIVIPLISLFIYAVLFMIECGATVFICRPDSFLAAMATKAVGPSSNLT